MLKFNKRNRHVPNCWPYYSSTYQKWLKSIYLFQSIPLNKIISCICIIYSCWLRKSNFSKLYYDQTFGTFRISILNFSTSGVFFICSLYFRISQIEERYRQNSLNNQTIEVICITPLLKQILEIMFLSNRRFTSLWEVWWGEMTKDDFDS